MAQRNDDVKEQPKEEVTKITEVAIDLQLINNKLNYIINLLEK